MPIDVLLDTIQPFPTFSEIYLNALKSLHKALVTTRPLVEAGAP